MDSKPKPPSPWKCVVCGQPVRIADSLSVHHCNSAHDVDHVADLSSDDWKTIADGLRMSD